MRSKSSLGRFRSDMVVGEQQRWETGEGLKSGKSSFTPQMILRAQGSGLGPNPYIKRYTHMEERE